MATKGTAKVLRSNGVKVKLVEKCGEGRKDLLKLIEEDKIDLIINTPSGERSQSDMRAMRAAAILHNIPCITTLQGAWAAVNALDVSLKNGWSVCSLQEYYKK